MKHFAPFVVVFSLFLLGAKEGTPFTRWQYATLTMNHFTGVWDFQSDDKTVSEDSNKEGDKILKTLGGKPYGNANPQYGSGFFPVLQQIGQMGYEIAVITGEQTATVEYYFKRPVN